MLRVGVLSDTHGLLDQRTRRELHGVAQIVHAGDIGGLDIVYQLSQIAPVAAVRGNMDRFPGAEELPLETLVMVGGQRILVAHIREELLRVHDPAAEAVDVVVTGHTHRALVDEVDGVLFLNPGSAGAPRFGRPRTMAVLEVGEGRPRAEIVALG